MAKDYRILAINPGSTSTKVGVFEGRKLLHELTIRHGADELSEFSGNIIEQFDFRKDIVLKTVADAGVDINTLDAVIGRGGLVKPIESGVYEVNEALKRDLKNEKFGQHASNLGGLLAENIAEKIAKNRGTKIPSFIADPVVVDELEQVARVTGMPEIEHISIFHALNQKAIAREYASRKGVKYDSLNLIVVHLGGGISVGAHRKGRVIDVNNALDGEGPFSPERAGTLPAGQFMRLVMSGKYTQEELQMRLVGHGGVVAHLDTNDMRQVEEMASGGDKKAQLILDAMSYNVAKAIGSMSTVLEGKVDAIILTGGIAYDKGVCAYISRMVSTIAEVVVIPGENELEALAFNALDVLQGEVKVKIYS